jgi:hypothetical protein
MVSYLGAFPFASDAPAALGFEELVKVITLLTGRAGKVLKGGERDGARLVYRALAVWDRLASEKESQSHNGSAESNDKAGNGHTKGSSSGFAIDEPVDDDDEEEEGGLALAALESMDAIDMYKQDSLPSLSQSSIPPDNLLKLIMLLLLIAPLDAQDSISATFADRLTPENVEKLRAVASCVVASFIDVEKSMGVKYKAWNRVIPNRLPYLLKGFSPLFEHFLFSKNLDFTKHKDMPAIEGSEASTSAPPAPAQPIIAPPPREPLLQTEGEILDLNILSQLSFFLPGTAIFRRLRLLYSGADAGFSMRSFETKVFNWRSPTILLVSGTRISPEGDSGPDRAFIDTLPPKRLPDSSEKAGKERLIFGVYCPEPWKQTFKTPFGSPDTMLFQLSPTHDVWKASSYNSDYISFAKAPLSHPGIYVGCPHPKTRPVGSGGDQHVGLGPVSLYLDDSFEFGVFTHRGSEGGGAFQGSEPPRPDFQDRFEIESLEVWGCGGTEEAEAQRQRWAWEEREAEARRRINVGQGDIEADRALLELAGIIGGGRSGGSMG